MTSRSDVAAVEPSSHPTPYTQMSYAEDCGCRHAAYIGRCVHAVQGSDRPWGFLATIFKVFSDVFENSRLIPAIGVVFGAGALATFFWSLGSFAVAASVPGLLPVVAAAITIVSLWEAMQLAREIQGRASSR